MKPANRRWYRDGEYEATIAQDRAMRALDENVVFYPAPGNFKPVDECAQMRDLCNVIDREVSFRDEWMRKKWEEWAAVVEELAKMYRTVVPVPSVEGKDA